MGDAIIDEEDIKKKSRVGGGSSCQEVSESAGTPCESGIMKSLFYQEAARGRRAGQEFAPLAILTPDSYSIFLCEVTLFFHCCLQLCATLQPLCFLFAGRG